MRGRVEIHVTKYRRAHDAEGRWDVTIDGVQVGGIGCILADREESELIARNSGRPGPTGKAWLDARNQLLAIGHHTVPMFYDSLASLASLSLDDALTSNDALVRALAYLDARLGRRRLQQLSEVTSETQLESNCLALRLAADGIRTRALKP